MLDFVAKQQGDKPFFVYYPTVLPHLALQAPQEDIDAYKGRWPETPYNGKKYQPHPTPKACYAAMITFIDTQVGRLMKLLKEKGLDDNTIVFFTSDNGTSFLKEQVDYEFFESVGALRGLKGSLYEGGIRVPMIARWPGRIAPATATDHVAAHYDVMETLADITNADMSAKTDGISFLPTLLSRPRGQKKHEYLFWDFSGYGGQLAVRMGKWKGIKRDMRKKPDAPLELYDLENDLSEKNNVAGKYPDVAKKIEEIMLSGRTKPVLERFQFLVFSTSCVLKRQLA
jgi:arylsulfatase A